MESMTRYRVGILLVLIALALVSSLWAVWRTGDLEGLALNFGTEMAGAALTYYLLELLIRRREEEEARKAALIAQLGSQVPGVALEAAKELRQRGWHCDGSLRGAKLEKAHLQGVNLDGADLQGANLMDAYVPMAGLRRANLQGANMFDVKLGMTYLPEANLQSANLMRARLLEADLRGANLQGVCLAYANLEKAKLDEDTILPDGTKWTPDTDMDRFTDPGHSDFWHPDGYYFEVA